MEVMRPFILFPYWIDQRYLVRYNNVGSVDANRERTSGASNGVYLHPKPLSNEISIIGLVHRLQSINSYHST